MAYTDLDLAQVESRVLAAERCAARQREILGQHIAAALPAQGPAQLLIEFEAALSNLRRTRNHIRAQLATSATQRLLQSFWSLPTERRREMAAG
jgi:hypothetical protein